VKENIRIFKLTKDEQKIAEFLGLTQDELEITKEQIESEIKKNKEAISIIKADRGFVKSNQQKAKILEMLLSKIPDYGRIKELIKMGDGKQYAHILLWKNEAWIEVAYTVFQAKTEYRKMFGNDWRNAVEFSVNLVGAINFLAQFRPDLFVYLLDDCEFMKFFKELILELNKKLKEYEFKHWEVVYERLKQGYKEGKKYGVIP